MGDSLSHGLNTGAALIDYVHQGCACDISAHVKNPMWSMFIYHMDHMTLG